MSVAIFRGGPGSGNFDHKTIKLRKWYIEDNCVYKEGDDEPLHCYDTKEEAEAYLSALYANAEEFRSGMFPNIEDLLEEIEPGLLTTEWEEVFETWVLGDNENHCPKCLEYAEMGAMPLGFFPLPGSEVAFCGEVCHCSIEYSDGEDHDPDVDRLTYWEDWDEWVSSIS